jgi:hypothetical protein
MKRVKKEVLIISLVIIGIIVTYRLKEGFTTSSSSTSSSSTSSSSTSSSSTSSSLTQCAGKLKKCDEYNEKLSDAQKEDITTKINAMNPTLSVEMKEQKQSEEEQSLLAELNGNVCPYTHNIPNWCPDRPCYKHTKLNRSTNTFNCISRDEYIKLPTSQTDEHDEREDYLGKFITDSTESCDGCICSPLRSESGSEEGETIDEYGERVNKKIKYVDDNLFPKFDINHKIIPGTGIMVGLTKKQCPSKCDNIGPTCSATPATCDNEEIKPEEYITQTTKVGSIGLPPKPVGKCNKPGTTEEHCKYYGRGLCQAVVDGCLKQCSQDCVECDKDYIAPTTSSTTGGTGTSSTSSSTSSSSIDETTQIDETTVNYLTTLIAELKAFLLKLSEEQLINQKNMLESLLLQITQLSNLVDSTQSSLLVKLETLTDLMKRLVESPSQSTVTVELSHIQLTDLIENIKKIQLEFLKIHISIQNKNELYSRAIGTPQENNISKYFRGTANKDLVYNVGVPLRNYMSQIIRPENWNKKLNPPVCLNTGIQLNKPVELVSGGASGAFQFQGVGTILPKFAYTEEYDPKYYS